MARFHLEAGAEIETVTPDELHDYFEGARNAERQRARGIKFRRLPPINGLVTASGIAIGGDSVGTPGQSTTQLGPSGGHLWVPRLISVNGLASGATPDVLNMQIFGAADSDFSWWQFNGNNFAYTFGKNEIWLEAGEYLSFTSQGAVTAAVGTRIRVRGMLQQVPIELAAELV